MWRRKLTILPRWLLSPLVRVNQFFNIFISSGNYHEIIKKENKEIYKDRDLHNLFEKFQPHISFTNDEEIKGKRNFKEIRGAGKF